MKQIGACHPARLPLGSPSIAGSWVRSSAVEHRLHTAGVTGSIPVAPTTILHPRCSPIFSIIKFTIYRSFRTGLPYQLNPLDICKFFASCPIFCLIFRVAYQSDLIIYNVNDGQPHTLPHGGLKRVAELVMTRTVLTFWSRNFLLFPALLLAACLESGLATGDAAGTPAPRVYTTPFPAARLSAARRSTPETPPEQPAAPAQQQTATAPQPTSIPLPPQTPAAPEQQAGASPALTGSSEPVAAPAPSPQQQTYTQPQTQPLAPDTAFPPAQAGGSDAMASVPAVPVAPPPVIPAVPAQPLRDQSSPSIRRYIGQNADAIASTFGTPSRNTPSGTGANWIYESGGCRLSVMIFPEVATGRQRVAFAEMQMPGDTGATTQACISHLRASRR